MANSACTILSETDSKIAPEENIVRQVKSQPNSFSEKKSSSARKPSVTVGVFCFNHEPWVAECLDSVLAEDSHIDVLDITDDASTDNSQAVIAKILEERFLQTTVVKFTSGDRNLGFATRLNEFLQRVETDYWCVVSADDRFAPEGLTHLIEQIGLHPDADIFFGAYDYIDELGLNLQETGVDQRRMAVSQKYLTPAPAYEDLLTTGNFVAGGCTLVRRFNTISLFDTTLSNAEDYDYWLSLGPKVKFLFSEKLTWDYRVLANSKYRRTGLNRVRSELAIIGKYSQNCPPRIRSRAIHQGIHRWKTTRLHRFEGDRIPLKEAADLLGITRLYFALLLPRIASESVVRRLARNFRRPNET